MLTVLKYLKYSGFWITSNLGTKTVGLQPLQKLKEKQTRTALKRF